MEFILLSIFYLLLWLIIRAVVLWYFKINRIVELLEQIERNTRKEDPRQLPLTNNDDVDEKEFYYSDSVRVTDSRLIIPPNGWPIELLQPVQVESLQGTHSITVLDKVGNQLSYLQSDNKKDLVLIAEAINKALEAY